MEIFEKIVNGFKPVTIFAKRSILDYWLGSEYASDCATVIWSNTVIYDTAQKIEVFH